MQETMDYMQCGESKKGKELRKQEESRKNHEKSKRKAMRKRKERKFKRIIIRSEVMVVVVQEKAEAAAGSNLSDGILYV